jgi:hypothetical protein
MRETNQEFEVNEIVTAKIAPEQRLKIRRYVDSIYYCKMLNQPDLPDSVYFGRELQKASGQEKTLIIPN